MSARRHIGVGAVVATLLIAAFPSPAVARASGIAANLQGRPLTPAGTLVKDRATQKPAVGALPVKFLRSPERVNGGRYLIAINSGYGVQFDAASNRAEQSVSVIDLAAAPPAVVQNVYFPTPQSANVGAVFGPPDSQGRYAFYVSGGVENRIWQFRFDPNEAAPLSPRSDGPAARVTAPSIDVVSMSAVAPTPAYNDGQAPVYPTGLAISPDGATLYTANDLGDTLGIVHLDTPPRIEARALGSDAVSGDLYPYDIAVTPSGKVYVSLWGVAALAVVDPRDASIPVHYIAVDRHPTALCLNRAGTRAYVVNSDADAVSVIDTTADRAIERIDLHLAETTGLGLSPEGLALSDDETRLYVANAHSNSLAVVALGTSARDLRTAAPAEPSRIVGAIPTGRYPSAVAVANGMIFIGNGKGTGFADSSLNANVSGFAPNAPNSRFPARPSTLLGQYVLSLLSGDISMLAVPDGDALAAFTRTVLHNNGLLGDARTPLFAGTNPIHHVIYVIRENRTYDQVFGDIATAGDGTPADGDPSLAIFGDGATAAHDGRPQDVTPNAHALARRFGLLDRFFVNAEASPDGHNWSTAAFSSDYVDKAFRWNYGGRGRSYDFEGFNRLPDTAPPAPLPAQLRRHPDAAAVADYLKRFVPYLHGGRDVAEPQSLYLWDAAARAGISYRNYGEFVGTVSAADVEALRSGQPKRYPDVSPVAASFATKRGLENHFAPAFPNFDLTIVDSMTVASYRAARHGNGDAAIVENGHSRDREGTSRFGAWLAEFAGYVADRNSGKGDRMPSLSIVRFSSDHTAGLKPGMPTPQFMVADNDYALGRLVEAVSHSPYWVDTAIFVVEDDAQAGPDHVDAHRSPALVISAYNRRGALVHEYHNTVSLVRTIELLLGIAPMNRLDATATPIRLFDARPDLEPYQAMLPNLADDNLLTRPPTDKVAAQWVERTAAQNLTHADLADPDVLNRAIWFSVRGSAPMPGPAELPAFALMLAPSDDDESDGVARRIDSHKRRLLAALVQLPHGAE